MRDVVALIGEARSQSPNKRWAPPTYRWHRLEIQYAPQIAFWNDKTRFQINHSGRRSGKTEISIRKFVRDAAFFHAAADGRFVISAPTRPQAKTIFWSTLKALVPDRWLLSSRTRSVSETDLRIDLWNGAHLQLLGMDEPARVEGPPLDGWLADEYGNMVARAWTQHVRQALSTRGRLGFARFIGVPEGRNHYYRLVQDAKRDTHGDWSVHHWRSDAILDPREIEAAKRDLDTLTYEQEYGGEFVSFEGRAYYDFLTDTHARHPLRYMPNQPLVLAFDFNRSPGVCAILQEFDDGYIAGQPAFTGCLGEVWIERDSHTPRVCRKLIEDWGKHHAPVHCYGDATGGVKKTQSVEGSDWDLIRDHLYPVFRDRLSLKVADGNPPERVRVNAMNGRIKAADGTIRFRVDKERAPRVVDDFEGTSTIPGSAGEIEKKADSTLTHLSDAIGYYVHEHFANRQTSGAVYIGSRN